MSTALYWRPAFSEDTHRLGDIKYAISPDYFEHDGTLGSKPVELSDKDIPYFQKMYKHPMKAIRDDAHLVVNAIQSYGYIEIWTET